MAREEREREMRFDFSLSAGRLAVRRWLLRYVVTESSNRLERNCQRKRIDINIDVGWEIKRLIKNVLQFDR